MFGDLYNKFKGAGRYGGGFNRGETGSGLGAVTDVASRFTRDRGQGSLITSDEEDKDVLEGSEEEEDAFLETALDESAPVEERKMALKEAIRICVQRDLAGEYGDEKPEMGMGKGDMGGMSKGKPDLMMVFGGAPKKK